MWPPPFVEGRPQERFQRHTVEQIADPVPVVAVLLMVEPQMVVLLVDMLCPLGIRVAEQVIEVPKIVSPPCAARTVLCAPQTVEQLVQVPTPVSCSSSLQRSMEQIVDIPASVRGVSGSLQGFSPEQSTAQRTALQIADIPVPCRGNLGCLLGFLPEQGTTALHISQERISERIVEQIGAGGDFPSRRAGPRFVLSGQGKQLLVPSRSPTLLLLEVLTVFSSPGPDNVDEHLPDSAEWVQFRASATCKP